MSDPHLHDPHMQEVAHWHPIEGTPEKKRVAVGCSVGATIETYDVIGFGTAAALYFGTVFFPESGRRDRRPRGHLHAVLHQPQQARWSARDPHRADDRGRHRNLRLGSADRPDWPASGLPVWLRAIWRVGYASRSSAVVTNTTRPSCRAATMPRLSTLSKRATQLRRSKSYRST
jgi:hypothetical protein